MKGTGIAVGVVFVVWIVPFTLSAQQLVWKDRDVVRSLRIPVDSGQSLVRLRISQQIEYTLTLSGAIFLNWDHDANANQVILIQDMIYQCKGETERNFSFTQKVVHHLGIQYFFDSISRFHVDDNQFDTRLEWRILKNHGCFFSSLLSTRLLNSLFLTPLTALFSGGIQLKWPFFGSLNVGITSAKLTWIRNKGIYESLDAIIYYGVPREKPYLFEYGISLRLLIDHDVAKWLNWNCDLLIFKNTTLPPDISFRNNLGFRLTKFLKARIQTRIFYEERISRKMQLENIVSVGFVVAL